METATQTIIVTPEQSAQALGSGTLPVFGTPAMVAFMESTAQQAVPEMDEGTTTVGTYMEVHHLKALKIGAEVTCTARLTAQEGRKLIYDIEVGTPDGQVLGTARHERFMVDAKRFMDKLQ